MDYMSTTNNNVLFQAKHEAINTIFLKGNAAEKLLGINSKEFPYPQTKPITDYLATKFRLIENTNFVNGIYMTVIFKDYTTRNILIQIKNGQ